MRVPRSQRGGEVVEPLVREQWFVRMQPLAQPALQARAPAPLTCRSFVCLTRVACSQPKGHRPYTGSIRHLWPGA